MAIRIAELDPEGALAPALEIRRAVFCREQGVPEAEEIDGLDPSCRHYLAQVNGADAGTARTRALADGAVKIERVAVLKPFRGRGVGRRLMLRAMTDAAPAALVLNAQCHTVEFYARLGFVAEGEPFLEAGIPHRRMKYPGGCGG